MATLEIIPIINDIVDYLWTLIPFYSSAKEDGFVNLLKVGKTADFEEEEFDNLIRKHIVILLLFVCLYLFSYWIIKSFKTKIDNDELYSGDEDFLVYRIALWICSCSLATSIGAITLLPFSIIGSEVLQLYPDNYYLKWLNWSLINSMWTYIFALSNVALFFLLPFSYFFLESQGLGFSKTIPTRNKTLKSRIIESAVVCFLVLVLLVVLADVLFSLNKASFTFSLFNLSLPLVYSLVSMIGVCVLLLSTPLGFSKMFDVISNLLITPKEGAKNFARNETMNDSVFDDDAEVQRLQNLVQRRRKNGVINGIGNYGSTNLNDHISNGQNGRIFTEDGTNLCYLPTKILNGAGDADISLKVVEKIITKKRFIFVRKFCQRVRNVFELLKYPMIMLLLLVLTLLSVSMVMVNTLQLLFGFKALPEYVQYVEVHSRHTFGIIGAIVETIILMYVMMASLAGVYSLPWLSTYRPKKGTTSMTGIIGNCAIVLLLSSALPVLARTLGITSFDLLGEYGRLDWISNFSVIMCYNIVFAALTILSLVNKFTSPVRREIIRRFYAITRRESLSNDVVHTKSE